MPIMDGIEGTKLCRQRHHLKNLPIIIVTAEWGENIRKEALAAGANSIISKPASEQDILATITMQLKATSI